MQANGPSEPDWRDAAAYAPLREADRSLFAWEWLRRDPGYRAAAERGLCATDSCGDEGAAAFGLVRFEPPDRPVPFSRPLWRAEIYSWLLEVEPVAGAAVDTFDVARVGEFATLATTGAGDQLLLSDGLSAVRLDAPRCTFSRGGVCLRYRLEGLVSIQPRLLTLQRFLAVLRSGRFPRALHPSERRAERWILLLRAFDAASAGASQREIADILLRSSASAPRWRSREPSVRSRAQRLVRAARVFAVGGYRELLSGDRCLERPGMVGTAANVSRRSG